MRRLVLLLGFLSLSILFVAHRAGASVSIAVAFDQLVQQSTSVAVVTPIEQRSVWENGRIYTYTRVHADQAIAGDLATGGEAWVRTMGGVVGHIGQSVDGEAVLTPGRPSVLFLREGPPGSVEVVARAQGQFPITVDEANQQRLIRSSAVGVLLPQKPKTTGAVAPAAPLVLAQEVLHNRPLGDGLREIGAAWKRLHAAK